MAKLLYYSWKSIHWLIVILVSLSSCTGQPLVIDEVKTVIPDPTHLPTFTPIVLSPTQSPIVFTPSALPIISPKFTITPTSTMQSQQVEESIPACQNEEDPRSMSDMPDFPGTILYANKSRDRLFTLHNHPAQSVEMPLPAPGINHLTFSKENSWILAYQYNPEEIHKSGKFPIWLISKEGVVRKIEIEMNSFNVVATEKFSPFVSLQRWTFEWVNDHIVRVIAEYGETQSSGFGNFVYGFYDVSTGAWWNTPIQNLPGYFPSLWIDISPDVSHILFIDQANILIYWDIKKQTAIWTKPMSTLIPFPPRTSWSNDGQKVVYALPGSNNLYVSSEYGKVDKPIPDISLSSPQQHFYADYYRWSPDNRLFAVSGAIYEDRNDNNNAVPIRTMLYIYDMETDQYIYRCSLGSEITNSTSGVKIIWSPDGNFIVPQDSFGDITPFRLFDLKSKLVYQIAGTGYAAFGWADQIPSQWK